jgi:biopolymer transport protein ExbB
MIPLGVAALALWFFVGLRLLRLRRGTRLPLEVWMSRCGEEGDPPGDAALPRGWRTLSTALSGAGDHASEAAAIAIGELREDLGRFRRAVTAITAVAPLLGLLGTVNGMIATFAALTARSAIPAESGVAGGISEALVSTQMGLFVAIPGLFVGRLLDQREARLADELERLGVWRVRERRVGRR